MAWKRKKKEKVIDNPEVMNEQEVSPMQNLTTTEMDSSKEQPAEKPKVANQKVVRQTVVELPTRPIREEIVGDTRVIYQTIGELIQENNELLKEIKSLAQEE